MDGKKVLATLVATVIGASSACHAIYSRQEVLDNLIFLDRLNPFEQQDGFLFANRNENANRAYFEWMGVSVNIVGAGTFARQQGNSKSELTKYDSSGKLFNLFIDTEFHPLEKVDVGIGIRAWAANSGRESLKSYAAGFPIVGKVTYTGSLVKSSIEVGLDFFKSFTIDDKQRKLFVNSGSRELRDLSQQLNYLPAGNFHSRMSFGLHKKLNEVWWIAGRAVFSFRLPLPYIMLPKKATDDQNYRKIAAYTTREAHTFSFQLQNGRDLGASFPFSDWTFAQFLSVDFENHRFYNDSHSAGLGTGLYAGMSYGIRLRAVVPYFTLKSSLSLKLMNSRQSVNFSILVTVSQW